MNKEKFFKVPTQTKSASFALLILRVVAGLAFMHHGWGKIQNPMGWMPAEAGIPGILQLLAAVSEFGGGLAWILGLLTPLASVGMAFTMVVATAMHAFAMKDPFVASGPGQTSFEPAITYLCMAIVFIFVGAGKFSLDHKIFGQK